MQLYKNSSYLNSAFLSRAGTKLWSPQVSEDGKAHPFKINLEAEPQVWIVKLPTHFRSPFYTLNDLLYGH